MVNTIIENIIPFGSIKIVNIIGEENIEVTSHSYRLIELFINTLNVGSNMNAIKVQIILYENFCSMSLFMNINLYW